MMLSGSRQSVDMLFVGFVGGTGGASVLMLEMAAQMTARGRKVKVVVPACQSTLAYAERCRQKSVVVERSPWLIERKLAVRSLIDAFRALRSYRAPVVHFHLGNTNTISGDFLFAMELLRFPPVYVTPHTNADDPPINDWRARRWASAARRRLKKVICLSQRSRQRHIDYGLPVEQVELIYSGVDIEAFKRGNAAPVRRHLKLAEDAALILVSSRIEREKRPIDAVRAFKLIASEFPRAHLAFIGNGSLEAQARAEAERSGVGERVHFAGYQTNVADWLAATTVWLLPTESEGFSLAVLEAMAAQCPVVSTVCPGNDELLVDGENALLAPIGDVYGLAGALRRLLSDERLRKQLTLTACNLIHRYSLDRTVEAHLACYADALPTGRLK